MSNNFKKNSDNDELKKILIEFLNFYCMREKNYFVINNEIFKKYKLNNKIQDFIEKLSVFYIPSKKYFINREITFNVLLTIIRQICKYLNINYTKKIIYNKNNYNIQYNIYLIYEEILLDSIDEEAM